MFLFFFGFKGLFGDALDYLFGFCLRQILSEGILNGAYYNCLSFWRLFGDDVCSLFWVFLKIIRAFKGDFLDDSIPGGLPPSKAREGRDRCRMVWNVPDA